MAPNRAKVKWVQNLGAKGGFPGRGRVGSCWQYLGGSQTPPEDWFPARVNIASDTSNSGRELHVVARTEQQSSGGLHASPEAFSVKVAPAPGSGGLQGVA